MRVVAAVDSAARCGIGVAINVLAGGLTLLKVGGRRVFRVVLEHLDGHTAVDFVLKV